jgi:hypothetical protein
MYFAGSVKPIKRRELNTGRFLAHGLKEIGAGDVLIDLVRRSNAVLVSGRKPMCWVIGDQKFMAEALSSVQARQSRNTLALVLLRYRRWSMLVRKS